MKGGLVIVAIIAVLVLVVGGWVAGNYNTLVQKSTQVDQAFAEVDNLLQRRNDLIPNLVETVKGVAAQEQAVFGAIANARAQMAGARTPEQKFAAGQSMDTSCSRPQSARTGTKLPAKDRDPLASTRGNSPSPRSP